MYYCCCGLLTDNLLSYLMIIAVRLMIIDLSYGDICDDGIIDSITQMKNGSIAIFRDQLVWLLDINSGNKQQLFGPFYESLIFGDEFTGRIESAVTIQQHASIPDFVGTGVYLNETHFMTYRNFFRYTIEWGGLTYMPHKGLRSSMGAENQTISEWMASKSLAAYFDPVDRRTKFVLQSRQVIGFHFELGVEFERPSVSTLEDELAKFGVVNDSIEFVAAFTTQTTDKNSSGSGGGGSGVGKGHELLIFNGNKYCRIKISPSGQKPVIGQSCKKQWLSTKKFLKCDSYVKKSLIPNRSADAQDNNTITINVSPTTSNNNTENNNNKPNSGQPLGGQTMAMMTTTTISLLLLTFIITYISH